jgi:plastocyanin
MPTAKGVLAMKARWMTGLTLLLLVAAPAWPAQAGGGHGCEEQTEGTGTDVVIADICFQPNLLHVDAGAEVSFLNKDPFGHNVYGTGWAVGDLAANGGTGSVSFADEGLFPFQCTLHPGMTGVIVVGDGDGAGNGAAIAIDVPEPQAPVDTDSANVSTTDDDGTWLAAGIVGLLMGIAVGVAAMTLTAVSTRRRERLASASA